MSRKPEAASVHSCSSSEASRGAHERRGHRVGQMAGSPPPARRGGRPRGRAGCAPIAVRQFAARAPSAAGEVRASGVSTKSCRETDRPRRARCPLTSLPHIGCPPMGSKSAGSACMAATIRVLVEPRSRMQCGMGWRRDERAQVGQQLGKNGADGGGEDEEIGSRGRRPSRRRGPRMAWSSANRRAAGSASTPTISRQRPRSASASEPPISPRPTMATRQSAREGLDIHAYAVPIGNQRSAASAIGLAPPLPPPAHISSPAARTSPGLSDCAPSDSASSGCGCTSTIRPSAPGGDAGAGDGGRRIPTCRCRGSGRG